jgi:hypothetical protein
MFLTTEDSIRKKLVRKLRLAGANMHNIVAQDGGSFEVRQKLLRSMKFGSETLNYLVQSSGCRLIVFDPIQSFIPPNLNMGSRNAMRDCLGPLAELGEATGSTFLLVAHTNKRELSSGRKRISDSADLWDIARSVIMAGDTGEPGIHYLSNEKNNYAPLQETRLFSIDEEGLITDRGSSSKRDRDFQHDVQYASTPRREDCEQWIVERLKDADGEMQSALLESEAAREGFSLSTFNRARQRLKNANRVDTLQCYIDGRKEWHTTLVQSLNQH